MPTDAPNYRQRLALGLVAAALVGFEVALTRIIAIHHLHHLASLIIALALLGFGAAGAFASLLADTFRARFRSWLMVSAAGCAVAIPASLGLSARIEMTLPALAWRPEELVGFGLYAACFLVVFFLGALFVTTCFVRWSRHIGLVYAADLIGSALGAVSVPFALHFTDLTSLLSLFSVAAAAGMILVGQAWRYTILGLGLMVITVTGLGGLDLQPAAYKELSTRLNTRGVAVVWERDSPEARLTVMDGPGLHSAPGLSIAAVGDAPPQLQLFFDGERGTPLLLVDTPPPVLHSAIAAAAYVLASPRPTVLLQNLDGGWQAWVAAAHGAQRIVASEANPVLAELLTGRNGIGPGSGFLPPAVRLEPIAPRRFHAARADRFDLILLTVSAPEAGLAAGTVRYDTTVEAFREALEDLNEQGVFAVITDIEAVPQQSLRLVATAAHALRQEGRNPEAHLAALRDWRNLVLLVSRSPINQAQQTALRDFAQSWRFDLVALPGLTASETNRIHRRRQGDLYDPFQQIIAGHHAFFEAYPFDVRPTTDNRPFFYRFFRVQGLTELRDTYGPTWRGHLSWGYLLHWGALLIGVVLALAAIIAPLALLRRPRQDTGHKLRAGPTGVYFVALGMGFMFVEIGLLQKSTLLLDATSSAFAIVVAAMLVGTGAGSYWLGRRLVAAPWLRVYLLLPVVLGPLFMGVFAFGLQLAAGWLVVARAVFVSVSVAAIAFPMGCALPQGMLRIRSAGAAAIAWAWAINGFASVIGVLSAVLLAMHFGFIALMLCASVCYLTAALVVERLWVMEDARGA